ncbi:ATP-binding cassette domain-containing protein [Thiococcus pfennigii]|uniref:ATP-binding cassette domain-containing protein n=1 Tax=Thiococcus pfennigii TaxID=1057 RepID=UPI001905D842|nr:ABC transporter [Thiococcus pfennigii]MBK1733594.1 ABC transporter [Thiococcus pfennigii]
MTETSADAVIRVAGVSFSYGAEPALERIDLTVAEREFLGIVGPNAGGKSTLLKLILGLLVPQAGRIEVLGRPPRQARRAIGYVPQYPGFARDFPISVEQVVLMGRLGTGPGFGGYRRADRLAARRALEEVEAEELAPRQITTLSGGQLQRVLLARALASEPRILILDEPTASVDQRLESDIFEHLRVLNERLTILLVSHDVAFISRYITRVACVNRTLVCHRTEAIDSPVIEALYGEPVRRVAHEHRL